MTGEPKRKGASVFLCSEESSAALPPPQPQQVTAPTAIAATAQIVVSVATDLTVVSAAHSVVDAIFGRGARSARSASTMCARLTTKMSHVCAAIFPTVVKSSHDARPALAPSISAA